MGIQQVHLLELQVFTQFVHIVEQQDESSVEQALFPVVFELQVIVHDHESHDEQQLSLSSHAVDVVVQVP